ncbi:MAG: sporulation transcriptional regulator SpoIIID [Christensenella sp.]
MKGLPEERAVALALYIVEHNATVRCAAKEFHISKSTVHKDVTARLRRIDRSLWAEVAKVLQKNKDERHLRGGLATRRKYHPERNTDHP